MDFLPPDFTPAYPEIFLLVMVCVVMLVDLLVGEKSRYVAFFLAQFALIGSAVLTFTTFSTDISYTFSDMFVDDPMSDTLKLMVYATVAVILIYSRTYIDARGMFRGEFFSLTLFAVKVPMWPVHTWLPDAHVEAPTGGSVVLAAILLKLGGYGFLRFSLPIAPDASIYLADMMVLLSLVAVVYIGLVALMQQDMKKLIAYSSVSHMGFVTLGFFLLNDLGIEGAMVQMISHGFISGAMFLCVGVLYDRLHSRQIADYGGVVNKMPVFTAFFMLFAMANAGLPGTSGFVGEFMVIMGSIKINFWYAFLAATTLILGAAYTLWMYKRVIFGAVASPAVEGLGDISKREFALLAILAISVLWIGVYPYPLTEVMHTTIDHLLAHVSNSKL